MWVDGRQGTGYEKVKLFEISWPIGLDIYLLRYRSGSFIPPHKDPVTGRKHYRLNVEVITPHSGGEFSSDSVIVKLPRVVFFRPDISEHEVSAITSGTRYVLSFGMAI